MATLADELDQYERQGQEYVLEQSWKRVSEEYARTVAIRGSGSPAARDAWKRAKRTLDKLIEVRSERMRPSRGQPQD
jgi:hypothetical protein